MAELNIKKEIGKRILEARKAKGLTLKALGELAGELKQTRLTNWEQGTRTPGPEEIKLLAGALEVSPAFLMCLSDEKQTKKTNINSNYLIPLLDRKNAGDFNSYIEKNSERINSVNDLYISVSSVLIPGLGDNAFAIKVIDESMVPEISVNDVLVIDPSVSPSPGDFVAVKMAKKEEVVVCQYRQLSYTSEEFELVTLNDNWPNITVSHELCIKVLGKVVQKICNY